MRRHHRLGGILDIFKSGRKSEPPPPPTQRMPEIPADIDLYAILEVEPSATPEQLRAAYRELARDLHPDLHPNDPEVLEMFNAVTEAYNILSTPEFRAAYDKARTAYGKKPEEKPEQKEQQKAKPQESPAPRKSWGEILFRPRSEASFFDVLQRERGARPARRGGGWGSMFQKERKIYDFSSIRIEDLTKSLEDALTVDAIMEEVREARKDPRFPGSIEVAEAASGSKTEEELAKFLGIPEEIVKEYDEAGEIKRAFWDEVLNPLLAMVPRAMKQLTPRDIPGTFYIDLSRDRAGLNLYYSER